MLRLEYKALHIPGFYPIFRHVPFPESYTQTVSNIAYRTVLILHFSQSEGTNMSHAQIPQYVRRAQ
jgi:hypothetical protein